MLIQDKLENLKVRAKGKDNQGFYFWEDIHHPCPPNKEKSEYPDASPNCFFIVCMLLVLLSLFFKIFLLNTNLLT